MIKIKLNLFEGITMCTIVPNVGFLFTTFILIISLISNSLLDVYKGIIISYTLCVLLLILSLLACFLINNHSKKELVLYDNKFDYLGTTYETNQISYCEYYVCKWYALPIIYFYKKQRGGLVILKLKTGEKIRFYILYKDYRKLKIKFKDIVEK